MVYVFVWEKRKSSLDVETVHKGVFLMYELKIKWLENFAEDYLYRRIVNFIVWKKSLKWICVRLF